MVPALLLKQLPASTSSGHQAPPASLHLLLCPYQMRHAQTLVGLHHSRTCISRRLLVSAGQNPNLTTTPLSAPARMASPSSQGLTTPRANANTTRHTALGKHVTMTGLPSAKDGVKHYQDVHVWYMK